MRSRLELARRSANPPTAVLLFPKTCSIRPPFSLSSSPAATPAWRLVLGDVREENEQPLPGAFRRGRLRGRTLLRPTRRAAEQDDARQLADSTPLRGGGENERDALSVPLPFWFFASCASVLPKTAPASWCSLPGPVFPPDD